jgi:hypothetical protein
MRHDQEAPITTSIRQIDPSPLSNHQLVAKDPLFRLFHKNLGAAVTIILNVLLAALVFLADILRKEPSDRPLELLTSLRKLLLIPFGLSIYFLLPRWITALFNGLKINRVISKSRSADYDYDDFQKDAIRRIGGRMVSVSAFAFVVGFWIYRLLTYSHKRPLWLEVATLIVVYGLPYYAYLVTIIKFCLALFSTKRLCVTRHSWQGVVLSR